MEWTVRQPSYPYRLAVSDCSTLDSSKSGKMQISDFSVTEPLMVSVSVLRNKQDVRENYEVLDKFTTQQKSTAATLKKSPHGYQQQRHTEPQASPPREETQQLHGRPPENKIVARMNVKLRPFQRPDRYRAYVPTLVANRDLLPANYGFPNPSHCPKCLAMM